jgi:SAM-dependent methyltransferase
MRLRLTAPPLAFPYRMLAGIYDDVIGRTFFGWVRRMFADLVHRHRIAFDSAADLGCGTGLFARHLSRGWRVPVFGVDLSPAMLQIAARNCRGTPVALLHQDIRQLRLPHRVDLITANFDTVNHLLHPADLLSLFQHVHRALNDNGHFVFDFIPPCSPRASVSVHHGRSADGSKEVTQRIRWTPSNRLLSYRIRVRGPSCGSNGIELHTERTYAPRDIARWLAESGFIVREVLDAQTLRQRLFCPRRVVVVAQKRPAN